MAERPLPETAEIAVIGAGPAGLAAAGLAAEAGADVVLLDEQPEAGGQIYRAIGSVPAARAEMLGPDFRAGAALLPALALPGLRHVPGATVWDVSPDREISFSVAGAAHRLRARQAIVATGATERPVPFPGWTLPGVMTAGAGQILLKTAGMVPPAPLVLAGSGPLLFLVASQYLAAGAEVAAIVETTPAGNRTRALRHLPGALAGHATLRKGLGLLAALRRAGVPHYRRATGLVAEGDGRVQVLSFSSGGVRHRVAAAALLIHTGVVPNVQISRALRLAHEWDPLQLCWRPRLDPMGRTSAEGILIAGDGGGIAGAEAAVPGGQLAAIAALEALGHGPPGRAGAAEATHRRALRVRPFLDALYAPAPEFLDPPDETVLCRCEEVTAGQVRGFADLGCLGPNQVKAFCRAGMGPCQGRYCGLTVASVIAARRGVTMAEVGYYRLRPPLKPVTIGELAAMAEAGGAE